MMILVTGGSGYLGRSVVPRLLDARVGRVRCLVRPGLAREALVALRGVYGETALEVMEGNLTRKPDVERAVRGATCVVHLAACMRGAPADMFLNTVVASQHLFEAAAREAVRRLVVVSSLGVYGLSDITPDRTVTEDLRLDPAPERRDAYAYTKIRQELALRAAISRSPVETIVLRPGPLYGRGQGGLPARLGLVLPGFLLRLGANAPLPLSHVDHCADAVQLAACSTSFPPGTYNVVDDALPSVEEYLALYRRHVGPLRVLPFPLPVTLAAARGNAWLHVRSRGQVPLVLTPYRVRNLWRGHRYENARLKEAGWRQRTPTTDALLQAFRELKARLNTGMRLRPDAHPDDGAEILRRSLGVPQMPMSR